MTGDAIAVDAATQGFGIRRVFLIGSGLMLVSGEKARHDALLPALNLTARIDSLLAYSGGTFPCGAAANRPASSPAERWSPTG